MVHLVFEILFLAAILCVCRFDVWRITGKFVNVSSRNLVDYVCSGYENKVQGRKWFSVHVSTLLQGGVNFCVFVSTQHNLRKRGWFLNIFSG